MKSQEMHKQYCQPKETTIQCLFFPKEDWRTEEHLSDSAIMFLRPDRDVCVWRQVCLDRLGNVGQRNTQNPAPSDHVKFTFPILSVQTRASMHACMCLLSIRVVLGVSQSQTSHQAYVHRRAETSGDSVMSVWLRVFTGMFVAVTSVHLKP